MSSVGAKPTSHPVLVLPQGPAAVDAYCRVARKHGLTPSQLALAHCNSRDFVTSTIIGATTTQQLAENLAAFRYEWTQVLATPLHAHLAHAVAAGHARIDG